MEDVYRDASSAALARADALERENRRLKENVAALERKVDILESRAARPQTQRFGGARVVAMVIALIVAMGATLWTALEQLSARAAAVSANEGTRAAPSPPEVPPVPPVPPVSAPEHPAH